MFGVQQRLVLFGAVSAGRLDGSQGCVQGAAEGEN